MKLTANRIGITASLVFLLGIPAVVVYPFTHNYYIHPLGRLARSISLGDSCPLLLERLARYEKRHPSPDLQFTRPTYKAELRSQRPIDPPQSGMFIYDTSIFDDVQLSVRCSADNAVAEVLFIGD